MAALPVSHGQLKALQSSRGELAGAVRASSFVKVQGKSRVNCAISYAPPATARSDILAEAEERFERVERRPLDGVLFTAGEFEEALEKYDFDFDIGDKVGELMRPDAKEDSLMNIGHGLEEDKTTKFSHFRFCCSDVSNVEPGRCTA